MKKSILSLSAAVALGGLGFAGSAQAIGYIGAGTVPAGMTAATTLALNAGGTGHKLFTPYYTAAGTMATMINITNTDGVNGKAVKVRFRGAANSDDVLDFTVFLSPGDVWSASVTRNGGGLASISTTDKSCTIPDSSAWPAAVSDLRLPSYLTAEQKAANANEGYIEVLTMADIPPTLVGGSTANPLFKNIKHVNGTAPCVGADFATVLSPVATDLSGAHAAGLAASTGGLMGSWAVANQTDLAMFSGNMVAVMAASNPGLTNQVPVNGVANIMFTPQVDSNLDTTAYPTASVTADPLLQNGIITPLWFDLPDMSTPMVVTPAPAAPEVQTAALSAALTHKTVVNDYVATAAGAAVPMVTDWVVSQPTRRYFAAMNYGASASAASISYNTGMATNPYSGNLNKVNTAMGPQACMLVGFGSNDREEKIAVTGGSFSPGASAPTCGEVFVVKFGATSILQAAVTTRQVTPVGTEGWAMLTLPGPAATTTVPAGIPVVGFAATSVSNKTSGATYGLTLPHRFGN